MRRNKIISTKNQRLMYDKYIAIKKRNKSPNFYTVLLLVLLLCGSCKNLIEQDRVQIARVEEATTQDRAKGQVLPITAQAIINERVINLEVARTPQQQAMGLMFREALPDDRGMFFPFEEARIARFWMNNVPVALDMIFVKEGKVVEVTTAPPCDSEPQDCPLYGPDTIVDGVIELRGGRANELELATGDAIEIEFLEPPQQN